MDNLMLSLAGSVGMMLVAAVAVIGWRRISQLPWRWFWLGAGLWTVAVVLKVILALLTNRAAIGFLKETLSYPCFLFGAGLFLGIQSSLCEIGLTLLAVLIWREFGRDANRAIGIGVGAGAFEAFLLGIGGFVAVLALMAGIPGMEPLREEINAVAAVTAVFWLVAPAERVIAIVCHASTRALVLLGTARRRPMMVFWGFLIFTLVDGMAGATLVSGKIDQISRWWIELILLPFVLVGVPILRWCYLRWGESAENDGSLPGGRPGAPEI